ncbi:SCO3374 family protein [Streptomyces sp. CME 23]|nr:SCO3374 family protein [Streptomyces sp. CME 23]MCH5675021.1 SCO3374 family protein [Streptomyces sp. CME 23]
MVPLPRRPLDPADAPGDHVRRWYENELGWPTVPADPENPGHPVRLRVGERFDVLEVPAEAGRAGLRHLAPASPVAVCGDRMRLLVAAGSAEELPGLLEWLEWGPLALDLTATGEGGVMDAPLPPEAVRPGAVPRRGEALHPGEALSREEVLRPEANLRGEEALRPEAALRREEALRPEAALRREEALRPEAALRREEALRPEAALRREEALRPEEALRLPPGRVGSLQGAAVWLRPPGPGCEVEASLPTLSALGGGGGAPDLVRLVDTVATQCHRLWLRRACARPAASRAGDQALAFS